MISTSHSTQAYFWYSSTLIIITKNVRFLFHNFTKFVKNIESWLRSFYRSVHRCHYVYKGSLPEMWLQLKRTNTQCIFLYKEASRNLSVLFCLNVAPHVTRSFKVKQCCPMRQKLPFTNPLNWQLMCFCNVLFETIAIVFALERGGE